MPGLRTPLLVMLIAFASFAATPTQAETVAESAGDCVSDIQAMLLNEENEAAAEEEEACDELQECISQITSGDENQLAEEECELGLSVEDPWTQCGSHMYYDEEAEACETLGSDYSITFAVVSDDNEKCDSFEGVDILCTAVAVNIALVAWETCGGNLETGNSAVAVEQRRFYESDCFLFDFSGTGGTRYGSVKVAVDPDGHGLADDCNAAGKMFVDELVADGDGWDSCSTTTVQEGCDVARPNARGEHCAFHDPEGSPTGSHRARSSNDMDADHSCPNLIFCPYGTDRTDFIQSEWAEMSWTYV